LSDPALSLASPEILTQAVKEALARVLGTDKFRNSPQLAAFLTFVVEKTLRSETADIKGYTIATQALGRGVDFDPQLDPIVRVEAARLRLALDAYYANEGRSDPLRIDIPRGKYIPEWNVQRTDTPLLSPRENQPTVSTPSLNGIVSPSNFFPLALPKSLEPEVPDTSQEGMALELLSQDSGRFGSGGTGRTVSYPILFILGFLALCLGGLTTLFITRTIGGTTPAQAFERPLLEVSMQSETVLATDMTTVSNPKITSLNERSEWFRRTLVEALTRFDEIDVFQPIVRAPPPLDEKTLPSTGHYKLDVRWTNQIGAIDTDTIAISITLSHARTGRIVWSQPNRTLTLSRENTGDRSRFNEIVNNIATQVARPYGVLFSDVRKQSRPGDYTGAACLVRAEEYWLNPTVLAHRDVRRCLEGIVQSSPFATVHAQLVHIYLEEYYLGFNARPEPLVRAAVAAARARDTSPESARAHQALMAVTFANGKVLEAINMGLEALRLNPLDPDISADLGSHYVQIGRISDGLMYLKRARDETTTRPPAHDFFLFLAFYIQGDISAARDSVRRIVSDTYDLGLIARAIIAHGDGDQTLALQLTSQVLELHEELRTNPRAYLNRRTFDPEVLQRLLLDFCDAGLREKMQERYRGNCPQRRS
jgi:tetratricopeptide (TPR) repeat protein